MSRRLLLAGTTAAPFAGWVRLAGAATPKDTAVFAKQIDDIISLDPHESYELSGGEICANVYDRVLRYEAEDHSKLTGGVAESWTVSPDGKTLAFKIRPNLKFHSGAPVTAEDVEFSLQRVVLIAKTPAFLLTQLGWTKATVKDLVKASGDTVTAKITEDFAPSLVLNLMSSIVASVVEKKVALAHETNGDMGNGWLKTNSAASGAFRLVAWKANESVSLEANPEFRLGAPSLKRVVVRHVPEPASQRLLLEKADADFARDLTPDQIKPLAGNPDIKVESFKAANTFYMGLNLGYEPLANPKVRQAMKMLVDYDGMVKSFLAGRFFVQQSFLPIGFFGAIAYAPFTLDVAKAKALLAEAGYAEGFPVKMAAPNVSPWTEISQSVQQTMGQAGIKVSIEPMELKAVIGQYRARNHQIAMLSWGPDYFDPHTNADSFVHNDDNSDNPKIKPIAWRNKWLIPDITKEMLAAARELDTAKRAEEYAMLQKKVTDDGPYIFMFQNNIQVARRATATGYNPGITGDQSFFRTIRKS
ncbi:MAG: ABC transporter substrate-binding protein [Alphaproteobacteria bacterium]|nr:ABC transporter substrate-binding protein [Alphaproteobacteria bacterium]